MTATAPPHPGESSTGPQSIAATGVDRAKYVRPFADLSLDDVAIAGGKGANLGEMTKAGLPVPAGFVVTVDAWDRFSSTSGLRAEAETQLRDLDIEDAAALESASESIRRLVLASVVPPEVRRAIAALYRSLDEEEVTPPVAVRSSATAEDTADFSFAGIHESFLNVRGEEALIESVRACWASAFSPRAIYYRLRHHFPAEMALAVVVQRMVHSVKSGVIFTVDPATRDANRVVIEAAWGFGDVVVGGQVTPDRYVVDKSSLAIIDRRIGVKEFLLEPSPGVGGLRRVDLVDDPRASAAVLTDIELRSLCALACQSESRYAVAQDVEFAIDGHARIFLTQTRPITTLGARRPPAAVTVGAEPGAPPLLRGLGASPGVRAGRVRVLATVKDAASLQAGEILVTHMTSPDWVPTMRRAAAVVTDAGGITSHAAIVSRELGIPCVVGTMSATTRLVAGALVTVDGATGFITEGDHTGRPAGDRRPSAPGDGTAARTVTATRLYVNLAEPSRAVEVAARDVDGIGLLRAEFMLIEALGGTHPLELLARGRGDEFVASMAAKLEVIAAAFDPRPVIYRTTDFRSNEFRQLEGGEAHEPHEANPMIGYRGCFRYVKDPSLFRLELRALHEVRERHPNLHLMIPFVRTGWELAACRRLIDQSPLAGDGSLELWVMAEVPSVVSWLPDYAGLGFSGVSIGSNDLTQLVLGVDRDSEIMASMYDERDRAVLDTIRAIISSSHRLKMTCSICGQAPSVFPQYTEFLVRNGIDSISVNPDAIERTRQNIAVAEQRLILDRARTGDRPRG